MDEVLREAETDADTGPQPAPAEALTAVSRVFRSEVVSCFPEETVYEYSMVSPGAML